MKRCSYPLLVFVQRHRYLSYLSFFFFALVLTIGCDCVRNNTPAEVDVNPLSTTIPLYTEIPVALLAGVPSTTAVHFELPGSFNIGQLAEASIDPVETLSNMAIVRTDGKTSPDPTVEVSLRIASGDPGSCTSGVQAFRIGITGNEDFSTTSITTDESIFPQSAIDIMNSGDFTLCTSVTSSVDASMGLTGLGASFGFGEDCAAPQDVSGVWTGDYTCNNLCDGESSTEDDSIVITVVQSEGTAIYWDDSGAVYIGSVCANAFNHLGLGYGYYEYGTFTRTGSTTATKSSTWVDLFTPNCGGTCSDTLNLYVPPTP